MIAQIALISISLAVLQGKCFAKDYTDQEILDYVAPVELQRKFPYAMTGFDYEGAPVWLVEFGKLDIRSVVESGANQTEAFELLFKQFYLRARESGRKYGTGYIFFGDMEGYNMKQFNHAPTVAVILKLLRFYTEKTEFKDIKAIFYINSNPLLVRLVEQAKPIFGKLADKIQFFDSGARNLKSSLTNYIPANELPSWYGGNNYKGPVKVFG